MLTILLQTWHMHSLLERHTVYAFGKVGETPDAVLESRMHAEASSRADTMMLNGSASTQPPRASGEGFGLGPLAEGTEEGGGRAASPLPHGGEVKSPFEMRSALAHHHHTPGKLEIVCSCA